MRILFLDIDGVLNTSDFRDCFGQVMSPRLVRNLLKVLRETGAQIVLSSSWRFELEDVFKAFECSGFVDCLTREDVDDLVTSVVDITPDLDQLDRSREVAAWVEWYNPKSWVAVDDLVLSLPDANFIQTSDTCGLDEQTAQRLIGRFKALDSWSSTSS